MSLEAADRERRRLLSGRRAGLLAAILVPLAFAGLTLAAMGDPAAGAERVPVALVNDDEMVTQVDEETGEESYVLAGRQLVTELTAADSQADFDWQLSNTDDAAEKLASGDVYAVLTIPSDFSDSILSIQSEEPRQAQFEIRTDDSHSYVAGPVAEALGASIARAFGQEISETFIVNILDEVGSAFADAADGAQQLAEGADGLAEGMSEFADGVVEYTDGVAEFTEGVQDFAGGVRQYAQGVREYAAGVEQLADGTGEIAVGVDGYADGVSQLSAGIAQTAQALQSDPGNPELLGQLAYLSGQLEEAAAGGQQLAQGVSELDGGMQQLSAGGQELIEGAKQLRGGAIQVTDGAEQLGAAGAPLAEGADQLADGAEELASGADEFAEGMREGAESFSDPEASERLAAVVSDPVGYRVDTDHPAAGPSTAMGTVLVPLAAWIGALAVFLAVRPFRMGALASSAASARILLVGLARSGAAAVVQAILLALVFHALGGADWELFPQTLVYLLLLAAVFTAFHAALVAAFGRAGLVGSFLFLAVQVAANPAVLPMEALAPAAALIGPYLPLSWASTGLQQILTSGSAAVTAGSAIALILFGAFSLVAAGLVLRRTRRTAALSLLALLAPASSHQEPAEIRA